MWQIFIETFLDWWGNQIWSSLIKFGQVWSKKKLKNKTVIFILSVNVTTFYCNIFRLVKNPIWSNFIHFRQIWSKKKIKNITGTFILSVNVTTFYSNIFRLVRNPLWSSLIHFGQIWSKKIKNKTAIFILVTFFDWWEIQFDQVWSILDRSDPKKSKIKQAFLFFL